VGGEVVSEAEERARDIRARLHQDMHTTLVSNAIDGEGVVAWSPSITDALVTDAMFQVEPLLVEIAALHLKIRAQRPSPEPLGWPRD
jgi:hypothetical protein